MADDTRGRAGAIEDAGDVGVYWYAAAGGRHYWWAYVLKAPDGWDIAGAVGGYVTRAAALAAGHARVDALALPRPRPPRVASTQDGAAEDLSSRAWAELAAVERRAAAWRYDDGSGATVSWGTLRALLHAVRHR